MADVALLTAPYCHGAYDRGYDRDRGRDDGLLAEIIHQGHVQNHLGNIQTQIAGVAQAVSEGDAATQRHLGDIGHRNGLAIERSSADTQRELCRVDSNLSGQIAATQRQAADLARELAMQAERQTAQITLQAEKHASATALAAATNTAAIQAAIAECCCEQKELIREEGTRTRELLQTQESARLRDKLEDCQRELLAVKLGCVSRAA